MRTLIIDFTAEKILPDGCHAGRAGEHNATTLVVTPPAEMTANSNITQYIVAFSTGGEVIHSALIAKSEKVELSLWSQLTQNHNLLLQLEGYDNNGNLVVKSPVVALKLLASVDGKDVNADTNCPDLKAQVAKNTAELDKFSEDENGNLLYNGKKIAKKQSSVQLEMVFNSDGETLTADKNIAECLEAFANGVPVYAMIEPNGDLYAGLMSSVDLTEKMVVFNLFSPASATYLYVVGDGSGETDVWVYISHSSADVAEGASGIYIGSGEMPEGYNVQIDPNGEVVECITAEQVNALIDERLGVIENGTY